MTFKSLLNWGGTSHHSEMPIDRYHDWSHKHHGHGHSHSKGGSKGGSAALSALGLLAFLFLLNVMQQSLNDNNSTAIVPPSTAVLLRDNDPVVLSARDGIKSVSLEELGRANYRNDDDDSEKVVNLGKGDTFRHD